MKVPVRPITDDERDMAIAFQEMLQINVDFWENPSEKTYQVFKNNILKYNNVPFFKKIKKFISDTDESMKEIYIADKTDLSQLRQITKRAEVALLGGNIPEFVRWSNQIDANTLSKRGATVKFHKHLGPWYKENPLFFGSVGLLHKFEKDDQLEILKTDLHKPLWTYLSIPESQSHDYEFLVWWIMKLQTTNQPVEISKKDFINYAEYAHDGKIFSEFKKLLKNYLYDNKKESIAKIISMLSQLPDIKQMNDERKNTITTVYRGIATDGMSNKEIVDKEKENQYVATSVYKRVAKRFALQIGHLESEESRRSEEGAILTYSVDADSILFDTSILGSVYGEEEVIIDTSKAKLIDIESV